MAELGICSETDDLGVGRFRHVQHIKPVGFDDKGTIRRIDPTWAASRSLDFAHSVEAAQLQTYVTAEQSWRMCPTRDPDVFVEFGCPQMKSGTDFAKATFASTAARVANDLKWTGANLDMNVIHAGHYVKLELPLKGGYAPAQLSFPLALRGLELKGDELLLDGKAVAHFRAPVVYDAANVDDTRPIRYEYVTVKDGLSLVLTLPDLRGMASPVVDPTLALQPDAAAGKDTRIGASSSDQNRNFGVATTVNIGRNRDATSIFRGLLQFDLSSVYSGAIATSGAMELAVVGVDSTTARNYTAHQGLVVWYEGYKDNVTPDAGQDGSTWNHRNQNGDEHWGAVGGLADTDYASAVAATTSIAGVGSYSFSFPDLVQTWVTTPAANFGLWLLGVEGILSGNKMIATSDNATEANRPKLTVDYTLPGGGGIFRSSVMRSAIHRR